MNLTDASKELFRRLANDAGNWSGIPMLDITKEERGNLTQLKKAGLVTTSKDEGIEWCQFTDAGIAYATEIGIDLTWIRK